MPECAEIVKMLSDYLDRDLPGDTCSAIDAHLTSCPDCANAAASLRQTVDLCRRFRSEDRPGPLPAAKHQELRSVFERLLESMRQGRSDS
jgi:RNA polymerase sigma-70 factor, ECF subfamily